MSEEPAKPEENKEAEPQGVEGKEETAPEEDDGHTMRNFLIAVAIIIVAFILVLALPKFFDKESVETITYNNFEFEFRNGLWSTLWERDGEVYRTNTHYNPTELTDVPITGIADQRFNQPNIYVTFDPLGENLSYVALSAAELSLSLTQVFNIDLTAACTANETPACAVRPLITCDNTNSSVIYLKDAEPTMVKLSGNCVILQGSGPELLRATDRFLYSWYRIMG